MAIDLKPFQTRTPDAAPRCPRCRYLLFRITELRCPECGYEIETDQDLKLARWYADNNAVNRRAYRRQQAWSGVGIGFIIVGGLMLIIGELLAQRFALVGGVKLAILGLWTLGTIGWRLWYRAPVHRYLFLLGSVWFAMGMLSLVFGL
jgi:hypothetical protein